MGKEAQNVDLEAIMVSRHSQLRRVALKVLGNIEQAEDVLQDAYLKILETQHTFSAQNPAGYVHRMVRNLAIDCHRRNVLERTFFATGGEEEGSTGGSGSPEVVELYRQELETVMQALSALPNRTRCAFELCRMNGYTQREVAQQLDVSATLVNFMIRDAVGHCRKSLD